MADEADIANDEIERQLKATLRTVNTEVPENDTGECIWCGGKIKAKKDNRRWCSVECRDEHTLMANKL